MNVMSRIRQLAVVVILGGTVPAVVQGDEYPYCPDYIPQCGPCPANWYGTCHDSVGDCEAYGCNGPNGLCHLGNPEGPLAFICYCTPCS